MMRPDQYERMQALSERLTDVFLEEAEPSKWPGHNVEPDETDQQTRGDRYWCKKNAVATLSLIGRMEVLADLIQKRNNASNDAAVVAGEEAMLDAEISAAEKKAAELLDKVLRGSKKAEFDKRVHGKKAGFDKRVHGKT